MQGVDEDGLPLILLGGILIRLGSIQFSRRKRHRDLFSWISTGA